MPIRTWPVSYKGLTPLHKRVRPDNLYVTVKFAASLEPARETTEMLMWSMCNLLCKWTCAVCVCSELSVCVLVWDEGERNVSVSRVTRVMNLFAKWSERAQRCAARPSGGGHGRIRGRRRGGGHSLYSFINRENYISRVTGDLLYMKQLARISCEAITRSMIS